MFMRNMRECVVFMKGDLTHFLNIREIKAKRSWSYENKDIKDTGIEN